MKRAERIQTRAPRRWRVAEWYFAILFGSVIVGFGLPAHGITPGPQVSPDQVDKEKARTLIEKAQLELAKNTEADMREALEYYAQAAQLDPHSAPAQVGLG